MGTSVHLRINLPDAYSSIIHDKPLDNFHRRDSFPNVSFINSNIHNPPTNRCLSRRLLGACAADQLFTRSLKKSSIWVMDPENGGLDQFYKRFAEAPECVFGRLRGFLPNQDRAGDPTKWTAAVDQHSNTNRIKMANLLWRSLCSAAVEFEICQVRVCRKASDGNFRSNHAGLLAFLLQEAAMDIMDSLQPPTERTIDTPRCNLIDLSSNVQETEQGDTSGPKFRTGDCDPPLRRCFHRLAAHRSIDTMRL